MPSNQHHSRINGLAYGVAEALRNPYTQSSVNQFHNPYSTHYAYMQHQQRLYTTPEGYSLSSTYDPRTTIQNTHPHQSSSSSRPRGPGPMPYSHPSRSSQPSSTWYQAGNSRCTYARCTFTGSSKAVEVHMMDRHLIYPPGWDKKNGSGWDADPSLKGKTILIQGTSINLNSPEALDAWIAERKKRWPTAQRVEEKRTRLENALSRGQLPLMGSSHRGTKRRHEEGQSHICNKADFSRNDLPSQGKRSRNQTARNSLQSNTPLVEREDRSLKVVKAVVPYAESSTSDSDDGAPEVAPSNAPVGPTHLGSTPLVDIQPEPLTPNETISIKQSFRKANRKEPKALPSNPFAPRATLLRNLILPEIRVTVSNLSQAIRFLVDNDFLRDVELEPGQSNQSLIEVVDSTVESGDGPLDRR